METNRHRMETTTSIQDTTAAAWNRGRVETIRHKVETTTNIQETTAAAWNRGRGGDYQTQGGDHHKHTGHHCCSLEQGVGWRL